ncbi:hypothetical protein [Streptomyces sp. AD55]|uniref:hypothetical protein n=1 Tax=Streptomyces sp. AD55 TaxID=3242895 RepID=UPI003528FC68
MRPLYVPARLTATFLAVAAAAGCVNVGDDASGRSARPTHSAGERAGDAPGAGPVLPGGPAGYGQAGGGDGHGRGKDAGGGDGKTGKDGRDEDGGEDAGRSGAPTAGPSGSAPSKGGPGEAAPTRTTLPEPPRPPDPEPTATPEPPDPPAPEPTPEPSSSAHEPPGTQLAQREPAPRAGVPV